MQLTPAIGDGAATSPISRPLLLFVDVAQRWRKLPRGIVGAPSLKSYAEAGEAADLRRNSAVGCDRLLGSD